MLNHSLGQADTLAQQIGRLIDQTTPGRPPHTASGERRLVSRYGRVLPVLLVPVDEGKPSIDAATFVICQDLSDRGMSVIQNRPLAFANIIVGIWHTSDNASPYLHEPLFVSGRIKSNIPIGGGFWRSGAVFETMFTHPIYQGGLKVLAKGLIPLPLLNAADRELVLGGT